MKKAWYRIWNWMNLPLPEGACAALGYTNVKCKVCWECVAIFAAVILLVWKFG